MQRSRRVSSAAGVLTQRCAPLPCSTTTLYHLQDSLKLSPSATALLNIGDLSYAGAPPGSTHSPTAHRDARKLLQTVMLSSIKV